MVQAGLDPPPPRRRDDRLPGRRRDRARPSRSASPASRPICSARIAASSPKGASSPTAASSPPRSSPSMTRITCRPSSAGAACTRRRRSNDRRRRASPRSGWRRRCRCSSCSSARRRCGRAARRLLRVVRPVAVAQGVLAGHRLPDADLAVPAHRSVGRSWSPPTAIRPSPGSTSSPAPGGITKARCCSG